MCGIPTSPRSTPMCAWDSGLWTRSRTSSTWSVVWLACRTTQANALSNKPDSFLTFAAPDIGEDEIAEVVDTLRSGWITTGPKARLFEEQFTAYLGGGVESIAVNSATAGLHLALEALGVGPGDEVITTT